MKKILFTIVILIAFKSVNAQYKENPIFWADKAFNNKDYYEAAYYYKKSAEGLSLVKIQAIPYRTSNANAVKGKEHDEAYVCYRLAESYRMYQNYIEAEGWYYKVSGDNYKSKYPLAKLWYGVCLRANQHFDEAVKQLNQFNAIYKGDEKYKKIANKEIKNCIFAVEQYKYPLLIDVKKMKTPWNSDGSDYSMVQHSGKSYFTSSRLAKSENKHLNKIYTFKENKPNVPVAILFKNDEHKEDLEYGTPSINQTGQIMYLTRWYKMGDKTIHAIYYSKFKGNTWSTPQILNANVNVEGFNSIQPFVTSDSKQLFFVSNKPGGRGGDDIWVSDLDEDGKPINSKNLGDSVNTAMDEEAPYYDLANKRLVYSSKGFVGLGGFDFFESFYNGEKWSGPKNLGYPFNSAKDDLYYFPDESTPGKFYISSDRESDCCLDLFEATDQRHTLTGKIIDCEDQKPLAQAKVSFKDSITQKTIDQVVTDTTGRYTFAVKTKRPFSLMVEKAGYFAKAVPVPTSGTMQNDTLINPDICLQPFQVNKPIVIKNILYDFNKATLRPESEVVLTKLVIILRDNPKIKVELRSHTDSIGSDAYNLNLSQQRAQACVDFIISKGISESRIFAKGYGKSKPIAHNSLPDGKDNPEGRQLNRRTEFMVLKVE